RGHGGHERRNLRRHNGDNGVLGRDGVVSMALDSDGLLALKQRLVPLIVPLIRESRAQGNTDPISDVKAAFDTATRKVALQARLGLLLGNTLSSIQPDEWNACVDVAA